MRVVVDQRKCDTTGICVKECPQIFRFQEGSKKATTIPNRIPKGYEKACWKIAKLCPSGAILIKE
jgi:ferredoxin